MNLIFPTLKFYSLKHLWGKIVVGKITKKIVREVIAKTVVRNKVGVRIHRIPIDESRSIIHYLAR